MLETLKKQWFVVLIACLLLGTVVYFTYDQNKGKLPGKTAGGKDVVFEINGKNVTADELYDELYKKSGIETVYSDFEKKILYLTVPDTKDSKSEIKSEVDGEVEFATKEYGAENVIGYIQYLTNDNTINSVEEYRDKLTFKNKMTRLEEKFLSPKPDAFFAEFQKTQSPRIVSHILIKMDDPKKPTAEELVRLTKVKDALAGGMDFANAAKTYSEDPGSAVKDGSIGYADINSPLDQTFLTTAMSLKSGETSTWIVSRFGYHLIKVTSNALADLKKELAFYNSVSIFDKQIHPTAIWNEAKALNVKFSDDTLKSALLKYMGITE
jgi:foldase protein PrsA